MSNPNRFTHGPLGRIFLRTALPIIFVMSMNGMLTLVDAIFLGRYVGPDALGAVTLIFPVSMLFIALGALVGNGMSSILARRLGADDLPGARAVYAGAHGLALAAASLLVGAYMLLGPALTEALASGNAEIAAMAQTYLAITTFMCPLAFVLAVNSDALRNEGRILFMAAMSLLVSLSNIAFNYVLIGLLDYGVAGSAFGTALANLLALTCIATYRGMGRTTLHPRDVRPAAMLSDWTRILALGAPQSLNFLGISLGTMAVIAALQIFEAPHYDETISAYGMVTRTLTFIFLPLLGLIHAMQSIVGNNYGAQAWDRSDQSLRIGIIIAFVACTIVQVIFMTVPEQVGAWFVDDPVVIAEFSKIMRIMVSMLFLAGPMIVIAAYFQAIGNATRAAILGLSKPYVFAIPLTFALPPLMGDIGIWIAAPAAEVFMGLLTVIVLAQSARALKLRRGLFTAPA